MTPAAVLAVFCFLVASGHSKAMQFSVLQPLPMDEEELNNVAQLPGDATRSEWDDENVHGKVRPESPWQGWRAQVTAGRETPPSPTSFYEPPPARPRDPESGLDDAYRRGVGTAGVGFGALCGPGESCSSSLGLACIQAEHEEYRCGCGHETPVLINEGGVKKCVRAKSMYESCVSHQECSYRTPNLQCVDFLCYCPLPYVLTESHKCLEPSGPHNNMMFAIAPTAVLIAVLLLIGGAYTYRKVSGGSSSWSSGSSVVGLRSTRERRRSESTRRVSSAIRVGRKAEASRRLRLSLDEHNAALRDAKAPRHPPRFIKSKPRQQSIQRTRKTSCSPDVIRARTIKEESTSSSESTGVSSHHSSPRRAGTPSSKTNVVHTILPVHEEVAVHIIRKSPISPSQELSTEIPWLKQARKEAARQPSPTPVPLLRDDALCRILNDAEVKVSVERHPSSASDDTKKTARLPPRFIREHRNSGSQTSGPPLGKFREASRVESTTEDSFMREIRFKMRASSVPTVSVQERAMSTDIVRTTDTAVQLDNAGLEMVDKSQQMSELPSLCTELKVGAPVHKLIQKAKSQQVPASTSEQQDKRVVQGSFGSRQVSTKEDKIQKRDKFDEASSKEAQRVKPNKIPERRLSFLKRMFPGSSASKTHTSVSKERPPVPLPAQMITERTLKAGDISRTAEVVKPTDVSKKDTRILKSKLPTTLSQKAGESSNVPMEPTRIPAFKDVLQELVKHYAEKQASKALIEDVACKEVAEKTSSRFMGLGLAVPATTTPLSLTSKTDTLQKGSVRQNPFLLKDLETMKSPSPPMSLRFYTTTVDDSDMLCPTVQGFIHARESRRVASRARIDDLRRRVESVAEAPTGSPNFATTTIAEETEVPAAKGFPRPHAIVQVEKKRADRDIACRPQSSCQAITTVGNKPFKVCPWGDSFSATDETPSVESRMEGNVPPNSQPAQILSLKQELEAADPSAGVNLEQTFMAPRMDAHWSIITPEAVLGSMDVESSETSVGGLRATFKQSVDVASRIIVPYEQDTRVIPALKSKKGKGNKGKKKVNFQEKPFTDVLAEIEEDYEEFEKKAASRQDDFNVRADNDSVAEASVKSSASEEDDDGTGYAFVESRAEAAKERGIEHPGKEPIEAQTRLPLTQGAASHNTRLAIQQSSFQIYQMMQGGNLIELATSSRHLSVTPSRTVSHPFCRSDEGTLLPSASTTLSFLSSDSNVSVGHRATDLTCLHALAELAAPHEEIGDGKSQSGVANLPVTRKSEPPAPLELHHRQLEPQLHPRQQYQAGEHPPQQQCQGKRRPSPPQSPSGEEKSARSSHRSRMLEQAKCQDSVENRSARPPKRPNTGDRQRMGRFTAKERRWGDDILRVIMMGNKHYLRERSLSTPRPRSASIIGAAPLLDETQYITQQIEQTHAAVSDADHACPSPELRQAALTAQVVATEVRSQDSSAGAVSGLVQPWTDQRVLSPTSPSGQMSPRSSQRMCSRPPSSLVSPDPHGARHVTWGPGGEQRKMDTIAEAVCEIELKDPQAVMGALALKVSELETAGDVFSGDSLAKSPIQVVVVNDNENLAPSLASGLGTESRLTHICPQWDVCERDLMASVKMLSAAVGTPESFEKSIELPSPEGLLMSETSTMPSRVDTVGLSSVGGSAVLDACASALSYTRTGSSKNVRSRRLSTKLLEGPCFESIYNSILQPGSSSVVSLSIPGLGSRDFTGFYGPRDRLSGPTFEQSTFSCRTDGSKIDGGSADAATTSGSASFVPDTQEHGGFDEVHARRRVDTTAIRSQEPTNSMPPPSDRPWHRSGIRRSGSQRRASRTPRSGTLSRQGSSAALPEGSVVEVMATESKGGPAAVDVDSEEDRSSFFSFEESVSETSLVPDATNLDWSATSYASRSHSDIA